MQEEDYQNIFKIITDESQIGIYIIQNNKIKYFNNKVLEVLGFSREEVENWTLSDFVKFIHPEDKEFALQQARKKQAGDKDKPALPGALRIRKRHIRSARVLAESGPPWLLL